jgi:Flp pilus assembly protein TadB
MNNNNLKLIITIGITVILFILAIKILTTILKVLVPLAIVVIAGYIVYRLISKRRY